MEDINKYLFFISVNLFFWEGHAFMEAYDVALSFAGENRFYVKQVADFLEAYGVNYFYDDRDPSDLWGKGLEEYFTLVFGSLAKYAVIFISEHYPKKEWCMVELNSFLNRGCEYSSEHLLPVRFDDTFIDGINPKAKYYNLNTISPHTLGVYICQKIGKDISGQKASLAPIPWNPATVGIAEFNYSHNNGCFRIGEGLYCFETKWSKASDKCIHCYNDPSSIIGIALAPKGCPLEDISDANIFNYSSRSRTPEIGQIVTIENENHYFAALRIIEICDDTRGSTEDKLVFKYWILTDGSSDFSHISQ
jgi:hypothetical protein